jgi:hypothetical protein
MDANYTSATGGISLETTRNPTRAAGEQIVDQCRLRRLDRFRDRVDDELFHFGFGGLPDDPVRFLQSAVKDSCDHGWILPGRFLPPLPQFLIYHFTTSTL